MSMTLYFDIYDVPFFSFIDDASNWLLIKDRNTGINIAVILLLTPRGEE